MVSSLCAGLGLRRYRQGPHCKCDFAGTRLYDRRWSSGPSSSQRSRFLWRRTDSRHRRCDHVFCDRRCVGGSLHGEVNRFKVRAPSFHVGSSCVIFMLRGARQERFSACIFEQFAPCIFPSLRVASEFFCSSQLQIQEAAEARGSHRQWSPGTLSKPPPSEGQWERGRWCAGARGAFLRWERVDPEGWGVAMAALRRGARTRKSPRATKGSVSPHAPRTHRDRAAPVRARWRHAHAPRNRTRGLLGSQIKEVSE